MMEDVFNTIYSRRVWGGMSGPGSTIPFNEQYFQFMSNFLHDYKIKSVVDLGCGDFVVSKKIFFDTDIDYTGIDCVSFIVSMLQKLYKDNNHIRFLCYDVFSQKEDIPAADLFLLKDILQHWKNKYVYEFLDYMVSVHKHTTFMIVNSCKQFQDDQDTYRDGYFRNLSALFLPLKKYNPEVVFKYNDKEVSIIKPYDTKDNTPNMEKS
jgi:hypothetical protein